MKICTYHICMLVSIAFLLCAPPENVRVLIKMMDKQEKYFSEELVSQFSTDDDRRLEVIRYTAVDSIESELEKYPGKIALIKVPFEKSWSLVQRGKIMPLHSFLGPEAIREFNDTYLFTFLGRQHNIQFFIPRKYETRIMVYRKSKVKHAATLWRTFRDTISECVKHCNGKGLPASYVLEENPNLWDYFDILVVGWIWARMEYNGITKPRIAHRGKMYSGTSHRIIDRVFQCNGTDRNVITMQGEPVVDAFYWEAIYAASGIYNPRMWVEEWSGTDIWQGFAGDEVFLSFMTQLDCFNIHGTGQDGLEGFLADPDDMGVATMPAGCSFALAQNGEVLWKGRKTITTGGWWWAIPADAPDPHISYKLARFITGKEHQVQGCSRFGMIPVRKDVRNEMDSLFEAKWMKEIYDISYEQMVYNKSTVVPQHSRFHEISKIYLDAWSYIIVNRNWSEDRNMPNRTYIQKVIEIKYIPLLRRYKQG